MNKNNSIAYISFVVIMIALGASDAMRGVFAPIFQKHFVLSTTQLSMIVTVSYVGNLIFLLYGGRFADKYKQKTVGIAVMLLWLAAIGIYLLTDSYYALLIGMFLSMGASTLMNTMINIMTPTIFVGTPAMIINTLFFTQGIGTTGSQKLVGMYAQGIESWKTVNLVLLVIGLIGVVLFLFTWIPDRKQETQKVEKSEYCFKEVLGNPAFRYIVLILGFYFVAEHGILNWFVTYSTTQLAFTVNQASTYLSIFFAGITVGRLIFAPVVQKLGIHKSITVFGAAAMLLYVIGILFGGSTILLLTGAGLFFSILYPTLIMMIQDYYKKSIIATATGMIISAATLFDIVFNVLFGKVVDSIGFSNSFLVLPICMILFYSCYNIFRIKVKAISQ
jgi:fucose permease